MARIDMSALTEATDDEKSAPPTVAETVSRIITQASGLDAEDLAHGKSLRHDLGVDSIAIVEIAVRLQDAYGIFFDESDFDATNTVDDITEMVTRKIAQASQA